jgi:hypothetical protein
MSDENNQNTRNTIENKDNKDTKDIKDGNISKYSTEENLKKINKIISFFKLFSFKKKVKALIKLHKKNYVIETTLNEEGLKLVAFFPEDEVKEYPVIFEPILNQSVAYVLRDDFKKRLLLKCNFINKNNESIIDPKYNNEFNDGIFINVINLKKIKEKEEEREDDFQTFLETYFTSNNKLSKELNDYFFSSNTNLRVKRTRKRTLTGSTQLKLKKLGNKIQSDNHLPSILKKRPNKRIPSEKRISFGDVKQLEYVVDYKKYK